MSLWPPGLGGGGTLLTDQVVDMASLEIDVVLRVTSGTVQARPAQMLPSLQERGVGWGVCGVTELWINQERGLTNGRGGCRALLWQGWGLRLKREEPEWRRDRWEWPHILYWGGRFGSSSAHCPPSCGRRLGDRTGVAVGGGPGKPDNEDACSGPLLDRHLAFLM